jgi:hypothetical protein
MGSIFSVIDFILGLTILVALSIPGRNWVKDIALPLLWLDTLLLLLLHYHDTKLAIMTICGWFWG